ncbi:spherulation-specific family 4 protein [Streptomyces sp. NBC_00513]|uniref:spherulation-specific family 4 protein n=1 Tax=unclassified Streptomyces TaxID=2593676 RepID=UPI002257D912|nr:spherulation-specific family 4 protein [Streptomyces sp. NBC_00424]MCX5073507.1 spherulation-specific family 4 protein [Streptomyces sp. NBC_00424]WUD43245.1 spherulation-specific family 4 protein [Streptomyces sp. NBC_00513]
MPHLTTSEATSAATGVGRMGLGIPGYAHPLLAPVEWAELTRPGTPLHWAVLNVSDGPGGRPDPHCTEATAKLRGVGGTVVGHLAMRDGTRAFGELIADAHRFRDWYGVGGFYLADTPCDKADLEGVRRVVDTLRGLGDGLRVVLGHGTHPYAGYAEAADQLVTFSGTWADYRWSQVAEWTAEYPPELFCHLVHGVPRSHLDEAVRIARWQGAGTVWFTDRRGTPARDPWASMPGYWDEIVSRIGTRVSE